MISIARWGVAASLLAASTVAQAQSPQERSFSPQLFHASPGPDEFVSVEPARPFAHKAWGVGLFFNYTRNEFSILNYDSTSMKATNSRANLISDALSVDAWAGVGLWNRFQIAVTIPMTLYQAGETFFDENPKPDGTRVGGASGFAMGDPRLHLKALIYGHERGFNLAVSHWLGFPFGDDNDFGGEKHFTGFSGEGRALAGWEADRFRIGAFFGFLWRAHTSQFFSTTVGNQLTYGGAIAFDVIVRRLTLLAEIFGRSDVSGSISAINNGPLEIGLAAKVQIIPGLAGTVGVGNGLVAGLGSPQPRVFLGFVYAPDNRDEDHDGVPDSVDKCLGKPEDRDGFQDEDGCPDPDNDKDGILDINDACPLDPEDHKPPKPNDGCPLSKTDTDGDGIMDDKDKCPTEPEDKDGFEDEDGCPDPDNDNDGIPDEYDQCPNQPEDMDGFQDDDGCPDPDNDKDGIPDKVDKCPNEPETINGFQDEDGCPDKGPPPKAKIERGQIVILDKIFFDTNKATIKPQSFNLLDQVAQIIRGHVEFKIRVEGHTDSQGNHDKNTQLSKERADSVRTYLIKKNVEPDRLISAGYGPDVPIADNKTSAGREANRRVEFHIVEEPVKKEKPAEKPEEGAEEKP